MVATVDIGHGVVFKRSDDGTSGGTFATVGVLYDLTPPASSKDSVDVTSHQSTARYREFIPGLKDAGEMSLDLVFDPGDATTTDFLADFDADTSNWYELDFNDGATTWQFEAFVTAVSPATPMDDKQMMSVTLKLTGDPAHLTSA